MIKKLAVLNFLSVLLNIALNFYAQTGRINNTTIGEISDKYSNLFTPADYAFSIWGLIYFSLLASSIFMVYQAYTDGKYTSFIKNTSIWFIVANIGTGLWIVAWLYEFTGMSVVIMFLIMAKLLKLIINNDMEIWDAPLKVIAFYWWPICLFSGWIAVASIANMAAWLIEIGWDGAIFSEIEWTMIMICVAVIINLLMIYLRNMREFAAVGVWALIAIFVRHIENENLIAYTAIAGAILLLLNISYHGYKNRKTNPVYRLFHGEKP
ncbi:tryptophan-rich sensory protein [Christiangramia sp. SM2212]|uniref:Tryptophan-rich sensory protein n=1 Tax=Christiangramia sediminicola TaxID=3073267 RepID=A0ABU1ESZ5_9FLAO|nr:tryptophan-rich sensory protein [Christiangramia sp. SM2212]MDR5591506.1 tryptophan-rich sensory protein [Christiangramia sp. SM2212]